MALTQPIDAIQKDLQDKLVEDVAAALKAFQALLSEDSEKYTIVVSLLARLNAANKEKLLGTLSNKDLQLEYNNIRASMLELIKELKEEDLAGGKAPESPKGSEAPRPGSILYRIPRTMPVNESVKCVVRIAIQEGAIVEDITIDDEVQLKQLYRVTETMQAEIVDPAGGKVFEITTVSEKVQLIDEEGFTEWWFYVTPLKEGSHPLVLKISIIELVNGQPNSKELVMEEVVQIVTDGPVSDEGDTELKPAGIALAFPPLVAIGGGGATAGQAAQSGSAGQTASAAKWTLLQKIAAIIGAVAIGTAGTWLLTPECRRDWWETHYLDKTRSGYERYAAKHGDSCGLLDEAIYNAYKAEDTPKAYRDYIYHYPDAPYRDKALAALDRLEKEAIEHFRKNPSPEALRTFLINFPDCTDLDGILEVVENDEKLRKDYLPMILQRLEECKRLEAHPPNNKNRDTEHLPVIPVDTVIPSEEPPVPPVPPVPPKPQPPADPTGTVEKADPSILPKMIWIKGGAFPMGSEQGLEDETPIRTVKVRSFYLAEHEVTFEEYDLFCAATNTDKPRDEGWGRGKQPVINVSWLDAIAYCNWLSKANNLKPAYTIKTDGQVVLDEHSKGFRLPTEAEWEYAARCHKPYLYSGSDNLNEVAWYLENSGNMPNPVKHKAPNDCGLYDMSGNVREWCYDNYGRYYELDVDNPVGPPFSRKRVVRGSSWGRNLLQLRIPYRNSMPPGDKDIWTGFRIARW